MVAEEMAKATGRDERHGAQAIEVIDLRDEKERKIGEEAKGAAFLGAAAEKLVDELIEIARHDDFFFDPKHSHGSGPYDSGKRNQRARKIGEDLNQLGGMDLMKAAAYRVKHAAGSLQLSLLNSVWHDIGDWQM